LFETNKQSRFYSFFVMLHKIRTYIEKHDLLRPDDTVIAGLSGGADSVALLHILKQLNYSCMAAHCNFHLRGDESHQDALFAQQQAASLQIPFYQKDFDTTGYAARKHISVEMAARELRYAWFEELRMTHKAQAIAVAHHQDDSVETVLLNLIRGTSIRGLSGIRSKRDAVIRPLLESTRQEILGWLHQQNITYRTDSSNLSDEYTRNFIRLHILPMMEKLNPSVGKAIARAAGHLSDVEVIFADWIEKERKRLMDAQQRVSIAGLMQSAAPQTVLYELLNPFGFTRFVCDAVYHSLSGESGKIFFAPASNYQLVKDRDFLLLTTRQTKEETVYAIYADDSIETPIRLQTQSVVKTLDFQIEKRKSVASFDFDKLAFPLTLRTWKQGDWFIPFGMKGRKKLSDYFSDQKFDRNRKDRTWLLCSGSDIIWIVGERPDDRYKIDDSTKNILTVHLLNDDSQ
jgi:tRNA(Ile)-lysidine synthase